MPRTSNASPPNAQLDTHGDTGISVPPYTGHDRQGIPHYAHAHLSGADATLLRFAFGVENPDRLYVSDSTATGLLKYDTRTKRCATCYVNSYRLGFVSIRRPGETWEHLERRLRAMHRSDFPRSAFAATTSVDAMDPDVVHDVRQMLADARSLGFRLHVAATYRSPEREAYLMWEGGSRTHTLTSLHSYGRALDIYVGNGNSADARTRANWTRFRQWVSRYRGGEFRLIGTPAVSWDLPHVEIPRRGLGFGSIDAALARARACLAAAGRPASARIAMNAAPRYAPLPPPAPPCTFSPNLPHRVAGG